jgi:hypothetical protein
MSSVELQQLWSFVDMFSLLEDTRQVYCSMDSREVVQIWF